MFSYVQNSYLFLPQYLSLYFKRLTALIMFYTKHYQLRQRNILKDQIARVLIYAIAGRLDWSLEPYLNNVGYLLSFIVVPGTSTYSNLENPITFDRASAPLVKGIATSDPGITG